MDVKQENQPQREADERLMQHIFIMDALAHLDLKSSTRRGHLPVLETTFNIHD